MAYIGTPFTVSSLILQGFIKDRLPGKNDASEQNFLIFMIQGIKGRPANFVGYLRLSRRTSDDPAVFSLAVDRFLLNENPGFHPPLHHLQMTIHCEDDEIASLKRLQMKSDFYRPAGGKHQALCRRTTVEVSNGMLTVNTGGSVDRRALAGRITTDWGLFECIPRLAPGPADIADLNVLENMGLLKESQHLSYLCEEKIVMAGEPQTMHGFKRLGPATVPIEYWVGEDKRLWAVICSSLVYVHQSVAAEAAPEPVMKKIQELLNR